MSDIKKNRLSQDVIEANRCKKNSGKTLTPK